MKVLDASALLELVVGSSVGLTVADAIDDDDEAVHVPHLVDIEVMHALRRMVSAKILSAALAREALDTLQDLPLLRNAHEPLIDRIWELRGNLTAYDATYVALAEVLDAELLTADRRLARSVSSKVAVRAIGSGPRK